MIPRVALREALSDPNLRGTAIAEGVTRHEVRSLDVANSTTDDSRCPPMSAGWRVS